MTVSSEFIRCAVSFASLAGSITGACGVGARGCLGGGMCSMIGSELSLSW